MRVVPLTGTNRNRIATAAAGLLLANEFHAVKDYNRTFLNNLFAGPVNLNCVSSEAEMVALHSTHERGCFPGDVVFRLDKRILFKCWSENGELFENWFPVAKQRTTFGGRFGTVSDVTLSGGDFITSNTRTRHGGFFRPTLFGGTF